MYDVKAKNHDSTKKNYNGCDEVSICQNIIDILRYYGDKTGNMIPCLVLRSRILWHMIHKLSWIAYISWDSKIHTYVLIHHNIFIDFTHL